ncbi:MAG: hypothetical protein ACYC2T_11440 [Bacillota bacterium]
MGVFKRGKNGSTEANLSKAEAAVALSQEENSNSESRVEKVVKNVTENDMLTGQGIQGAKAETWQAVHKKTGENIELFKQVSLVLHDLSIVLNNVQTNLKKLIELIPGNKS